MEPLRTTVDENVINSKYSDIIHRSRLLSIPLVRCDDELVLNRIIQQENSNCQVFNRIIKKENIGDHVFSEIKEEIMDETDSQLLQIGSSVVPFPLNAICGDQEFKERNIKQEKENTIIKEVNKMWITMESHYMKDEKDIGKILFNNMNEYNNIFELNKKNILKSNKKTIPGMDLILLNANLTSLKIKKTNSSKSLLRKNSKMYYVSCINIKNQKGECFSSLIDNLSENDRIFIINGVVLKQLTICNSNKSTLLVRSQDNSSVILFKCIDHDVIAKLEKSNSPSNLSSLTGSGVYSIYGLIINIFRYHDKELISLRLQSHDKSSIKTLKYFPYYNEYYQNIINNKTASDLNHDFLSNKVDILVKTPSKDFTSLSLNQQISLNNVTVEKINDSDIFLLHMNGYANNIKVVPMESCKTIKPTYLIPDELRPKFKKLSDDVLLVINDNLNTNITALKKPLNVQSKHKKMKYMDLSDDADNDDIDNLSPCGDSSTSTQIIKKYNDVHNNASKFGKNKVNVIDDNSSPIKHLRSDDKIQKYNDNSSLTPSNKDTSLPKSKICSQRDISLSASSDGSCSPTFFMSQQEPLILNRDDNVQKFNDNSSLAPSNKDASLHKSKICCQRDISPSSSSDSSCSSSSTNSQPESLILNQDTRSNSFKSNIVRQPTQCIGPCRLIYTEPNIFDSSEIVSGFCTTCKVFVQKCHLKLTPRSSNNMEYKCPKCSTIVHLTFFFIMNFLYGKNESRAIEVRCYDKNAESVVRKISKKKITLKDYLSNQNNEQLVISSMKSLINNRTKINIIVCLSPEDNKNILLGIDTKYVVTTTTQ